MIKTNTETVRKIQAEFANLQSEKKTLEGNHEMTLREAVRALYPTLQRMKKRGFTTREMAQKLNENGVAIKPATLAKYLNETETEQLIKSAAARRRNGIRQSKKAAPQHDIPVNTNELPTTSETE
ncbi:protein MobC [Mailhella sp.]|uniref:protein MobC n=1 Tax=Mailhella sp. TaxID=1981029 RepID=UPI0040641727